MKTLLYNYKTKIYSIEVNCFLFLYFGIENGYGLGEKDSIYKKRNS
jgi:hypothetical protein